MDIVMLIAERVGAVSLFISYVTIRIVISVFKAIF